MADVHAIESKFSLETFISVLSITRSSLDVYFLILVSFGPLYSICAVIIHNWLSTMMIYWHCSSTVFNVVNKDYTESE